jgi:ribonucleotide reductase beta subunit family protein with ferritin-like domain
MRWGWSVRIRRVDRLPELLERSLCQSNVSAQFYRHILDSLASNPTPTEIAAFRSTPEMQERLRVLLDRSKSMRLGPRMFE